MVTNFRHLPTELRVHLGRLRQRGRPWGTIAAQLNTTGMWALGQRAPWTAASVRTWYHRHTPEEHHRGARARRAAATRRLHAAVLELYHLHRGAPDRRELVVADLLRVGLTATPTGARITAPWVGWVADRHGVRVPAPTSSHWRSVSRVRPRVRADCQEGPRPCPWATCRHHMAGHMLAAAERYYRHDAHRSVPQEWREHLEAGDFAVLPHTCALDLVEEQGVAGPGALFQGVPDGAAIGRALGITRELVRLEVQAALRALDEADPDVAELLRDGYNASKLQPRRR